MPPLSSGSAAGVIQKLKMELKVRNLSSNITAGEFISPAEGNTLQILALTFATISVASAILAFYWFIKMRRTFRHDLIMLLIQSDMFKALWFMVYPIVTFTHGPVLSTSTFCQVNGFFLALGIEASDFAVLMIAIHTALYIFRSKSSGEGGLYPYRQIAYTCWVIFPLLMASLAFINDHNAYVSEGTYCYLPVRPFWYRLALAWIPRYLIVTFILVIYISIYYFVRNKFHGFNAMRTIPTANSDSRESTLQRPRAVRRNDLPPTPTLVSHGLIPGSRHGSWLCDGEPGRPSSSTLESNKLRKQSPLQVGAHRFMWASIAAPEPSPASPSELSVGDADSFTGPSTPCPLPRAVLALPSPSNPLNSVSFESSRASWGGTLRLFSPGISCKSSKQAASIDMFAMLQQHPDQPSPTPLSQLQLVNSRGQSFADVEVLRIRDKIRKQLRFMFIYPLVYIGMWMLPFASHVLQYDDKYAQNLPFGLTCVVTICVCSQAAVDCWLFSTREKPWRHIPDINGNFWASLKFWKGWSGVNQRRVVHLGGPGKTRDEMAREARAAYRRRDHEIAERRNDSFGPNGEVSRKCERSWWEVGADGAAAAAMSPLAEEVSDPMEAILVSDNRIEPLKESQSGEKISRSETLAESEKSGFHQHPANSAS